MAEMDRLQGVQRILQLNVGSEVPRVSCFGEEPLKACVLAAELLDGPEERAADVAGFNAGVEVVEEKGVEVGI